MNIHHRALRISLAYAIPSIAWVLFGDHLLINLGFESAQLLKWALFKGLLFVTVTSALLYVLLHRHFGLLERRRETQQAYLSQAGVVFDSTQEGVLVTDTNRQVIYINPAFTRITGYKLEEMLGKNPGMLKSGRHGEAFYAQLWKALREQGEWSGEIWNRRKGGDIYPQWQTIKVLRDEDGAPRFYVAVFSDLTAIKRSQNELARLVHYDPLTGLPNRLLFVERLEHALARGDSARGAVLLVNLDRFQQLNESYGHRLGDEVLQVITQRLQPLCSNDMTLARLGADEFALLVESCANSVQAAALANQVLALLRQPLSIQQHELFVAASVGVCVFPEDGRDAESVLSNAISACAQAKRDGRETYAFYTPELTDQARQRVELAIALRQAVDKGELRLHYQPIVALDDATRWVGVEALVRWQHPEKGMVSPADFIPLAEELGLISLIDRWVMGEACEQMNRWQAAGHELEFMAVNVSSRLFCQEQLADQVAETLQRTGLPAHKLEIEVTESTIMLEPELAMANLQRLKSLGVRLAIDDFGTGYSSFLRLKFLPIEKLKIDRGFISGLPDDKGDAAIVHTVIALARSLGLRVLAEGIETPEQLAFLRGAGCDLAQGYYMGRPQPAEILFKETSPVS